jgi:hypothetical protein
VPPVSAAAQPATTDGPSNDAPASAVTGDGAFRRQGDDIEWACPACGQFNSIDLLRCATCGTGFVEQFRSEDADEPRNWQQAFAMSAVAPGAGHIAIGRYGTGLSRLLLFLTWILGAILLVGGGGRRAMVAVLPLLLGAVVVYVATLVDLRRLERGQDELLVGRRLLWLVLGVLGLLGVALVTTLMAAAT